MPHMVIYRNADGSPAYHQTEALEDAVRFVEHIRNEQGVNDSRLFRMEELHIEFKTYYRVEVAGADAGAQPAAAEAAPAAPAAPSIPASLDGAPQPAEAETAGSGSGRFGLFAKG